MINSIKKEKDTLIREYIYNTKPPKTLTLNLLTYKALLMYFRTSFINKKVILKFDKYKERNSLDNTKLEQFFPGKETLIKVYLTNFPHLIGINKDIFNNSSDSIIEHILYEFKLTDDFHTDSNTAKTDLEKLQTFSWIISTLYNPTWIVEESSIIADNFKSDIVFIKSIFYPKNYNGERKYFYHLVGLNYIEKEKFFIIKSQFPLKNKRNLLNKFDLRKENLLFKRERR